MQWAPPPTAAEKARRQVDIKLSGAAALRAPTLLQSPMQLLGKHQQASAAASPVQHGPVAINLWQAPETLQSTPLLWKIPAASQHPTSTAVLASGATTPTTPCWGLLSPRSKWGTSKLHAEAQGSSTETTAPTSPETRGYSSETSAPTSPDARGCSPEISAPTSPETSSVGSPLLQPTALLLSEFDQLPCPRGDPTAFAEAVAANFDRQGHEFLPPSRAQQPAAADEHVARPSWLELDMSGCRRQGADKAHDSSDKARVARIQGCLLLVDDAEESSSLPAGLQPFTDAEGNALRLDGAAMSAEEEMPKSSALLTRCQAYCFPSSGVFLSAEEEEEPCDEEGLRAAFQMASPTGGGPPPPCAPPTSLTCLAAVQTQGGLAASLAAAAAAREKVAHTAAALHHRKEGRTTTNLQAEKMKEDSASPAACAGCSRKEPEGRKGETASPAACAKLVAASQAAYPPRADRRPALAPPLPLQRQRSPPAEKAPPQQQPLRSPQRTVPVGNVDRAAERLGKPMPAGVAFAERKRRQTAPAATTTRTTTTPTAQTRTQTAPAAAAGGCTSPIPAGAQCATGHCTPPPPERTCRPLAKTAALAESCVPRRAGGPPPVSRAATAGACAKRQPISNNNNSNNNTNNTNNNNTTNNNNNNNSNSNKNKKQPEMQLQQSRQISLQTHSPVMDTNLIQEMLADERQLKRYASRCFKDFDANGDGVLSFEELAQCMQHMNTSLGVGDFTERHVLHYLRRFDTDGDHLLNQGEFLQLYRSLLLVKLDEVEPASFCREMFISRRSGKPEDHYSLQGVLGAGSFGVVRKVRCRQTKVARVMKAVDKQKAVNGGYPLKMVLEEIDKLKTLDHPAVLRLFEYYADAKALYLITDLLPGGDLLAAVENAHSSKQPLKEPWVCDVFRQVSEGVAYCHAKGVMHKDLKLENIMLCSREPPEAVVIDVGLAELFPPAQAESFHSADAAGTLATMAPEVIRGSFTAKCDTWSLGCCLFALLCRRPRRLRDSNGTGTEAQKTEDGGNDADSGADCYNYFYPFRPPKAESRDELKAYIERQRLGPDLARLRCSPEAEDIIFELLTVKEQSRPAMKDVLRHKWLQASRSGQRQVLRSKQLDSLLQFHRTDALAQAVLLDMASQLPLGKLRELSCLFESMDKDGNGMLDGTELADALQRAGLEPEAARQAADRLARDGGGRVEFSHFVAALVPSCCDLLQQHLVRSSFDRLDINGDGFVSLLELQELLERGGTREVHEAQELMLAEKSGGRSSAGPSDDEDANHEAVSSVRQRRCAQTARAAFDSIGGVGMEKVSFESFQRHLFNSLT
ncbi:unnamed protein product [Polarella glacialis]|uniref:non-specific serine/threonine protein kinase n=1 Tax=Polarella glacialis TaxID=89957 RepID=A0A813GFH8_POLGL|nr:unnamed protein product [Polarella glacialis]